MAEESSAGQAIEVTVAVDDAAAGQISDVAARLAEAGLRGAQPQPAIGVITGSIDELGVMNGLEKVEGVAAVEIARSFQLPPPDSPIQ